jgi:hypothetical protein
LEWGEHRRFRFFWSGASIAAFDFFGSQPVEISEVIPVLVMWPLQNPKQSKAAILAALQKSKAGHLDFTRLM